MLIKIYDSRGEEQVELSPNDNSTLTEEIQGDSILALSFTHFAYLELDVDFYTDFEGKRYWLTEKYRPRQNNEKEWVYDLKLYGVESMIKRFLVIKTVDAEEEPVFTLTAPPRDHVAMIVKCMNEGTGDMSDWKVGQVDGTENIVVDYFGKYCDEALREIAEKVNAEWWVEGQTVNICRCEHGDPVRLGYRKGLLSIDPGTADNVKFYTRLYPVGSSRNIDRAYYGHSRLQLPDGKKFVEINAEKYGRVDHYEQEAFSEIYPRRVGEISSVRSEEKTGEDGKPFTVYYFTDNSLPFDPNSYMLPGKVIRVSFQEGSELAGLGEEDENSYYFEVNFNSSRGEFEIITIWPYDDDMQLPGDKLVPKAGDKYVLWNIRMPDEYYALAEEEFLEAVNKYNEDHGLDIAVYKAPTDHVWFEDNSIELTIGSRVRLESEQYFPGTGYRDSRVTKITRKVNLPTSMDIEISDTLSRTSMQKMNDSITDARNYARSIGESVSLPDIIRTGDNTAFTDNNLLSALRTLRDFLSKKRDDRTPYNLNIGGLLTAEKGARFWEAIQSKDFMSGLLGWMIDKAGNSEVESITVRSYMWVMELIVNRLRAEGSDSLFTEGDTIEKCTLNSDGTYTLKLKKEWEGYFTAMYEHNVIKGIYNNITNSITGEGTTSINGATYYTSWMNVISVDMDENSIRVSLYPDEETPAGRNFPPCDMMKIARWGNSGPAKDANGSTTEYGRRQSCFEISSTQGRIIQYMNVTKPIVDKGNVALCIGRCPEFLDGVNKDIHTGDVVIYIQKVLADQFIHVDYEGRPVPTNVFRGSFDPNATYYDGTEITYYNEYGQAVYERSVVEFYGLQWICSENHTKTEPSFIGTAWTFYQGDTTLMLDFDSNDSSVWADNPEITLGVVCRMSSIDLTYSEQMRYDWTRESWNNGERDHASDELWNSTHSNIGNSLKLEKEDMNYSFGKHPEKLIYTVTATFLDAEGRPLTITGRDEPAVKSLSFEISE